jgi:hypothetical protein
MRRRASMALDTGATRAYVDREVFSSLGELVRPIGIRKE